MFGAFGGDGIQGTAMTVEAEEEEEEEEEEKDDELLGTKCRAPLKEVCVCTVSPSNH